MCPPHSTLYLSATTTLSYPAALKSALIGRRCIMAPDRESERASEQAKESERKIERAIERSRAHTNTQIKFNRERDGSCCCGYLLLHKNAALRRQEHSEGKHTRKWTWLFTWICYSELKLIQKNKSKIAFWGWLAGSGDRGEVGSTSCGSFTWRECYES